MSNPNDLSDRIFSLIGDADVGSSANISYESTSKKAYQNLLRYGNVTSYSQLTELHRCPRKFQLMKQQADKRASLDAVEENLDFAFGHAVGAGVQSYMVTKDLDSALFNAFMAWNAGFDERDQKGSKSIWEAHIAVEKFVPFADEVLADWEILTLESGKPAIEIAFSIHAERGNRHYGHMDLGMRNIRSGRVAVGEVKTTKYKQVEEAFYANSGQGVSYATMLETLYPGITEYDVNYLVYSSSAREWNLLPFTKTVKNKAEWIKDLLLDHSMIETYERIHFYPKRGEACYSFNRRCQYFGECNLVADGPLPRLEATEEAEPVDYILRLEDIINVQKQRNDE